MAKRTFAAAFVVVVVVVVMKCSNLEAVMRQRRPPIAADLSD